MTNITRAVYAQALDAIKSAPVHKLKEIGDQWRTPDALFWGINAMFGPLVLDLFADESNAKCEAYYTAEDNALEQDWSARLAELNGAAFGNPPYSRASKHEGKYITGMRHIMKHTAEMRKRGGRYVFLVKAATGEIWWPEQADHVSFIRGRVGFALPSWYRPAPGEPLATTAGFAAAIVVFDKTWRGPAMGYVSRDQLEAQGEAFLAQIRREAARISRPQNIPEIIPVPETDNRVWPAEVLFIFDQVPAAMSLPDDLQNKIRSHINRMKLDGLPTAAIINQASTLTKLMGITA
ncbi:phage N-6-adenine-methyltransferase [Sodalis sp. RH24]|uniref:phage N-6-adenine-methyltransferase n=1 Tax=unclassified Sodalis (in: enterobacteria) TaxID=2636512 RepID=UPI0039B410AF